MEQVGLRVLTLLYRRGDPFQIFRNIWEFPGYVMLTFRVKRLHVNPKKEDY